MKETDLLESFLPLKLLTRVHVAGDRPVAVTFPAAVLFVDVSRYTALVEQLARRGQGGLERISRLLSLSYGRCADQICDRGGEVLYFEGDSLVAYWAAEDDDLGNAVRAAAECAEAICRDIGDASTNETTPALHVGVGAGGLWAAVLGGKPVWNLVAGGDALIQAATSQSLARPREYVLSDAAAQALAQVRARSSGEVPEKRPELPPTGPPLDWLASFLPLQIHEALQGLNCTAGRGEFSDNIESHGN